MLKNEKIIIDIFSLLYFSWGLLLVSLLGIFFARKNLIVILISLELALLSINLNFINSACFIDDMVGIVFVIFILTTAASEAAIGLALLVLYYRLRGLIAIDYLNLLKG